MKPYIYPRVSSFLSPTFRRLQKKELSNILTDAKNRSLILIPARKNPNWYYVGVKHNIRSQHESWIPKVYICVQAKFYFSTIRNLLAVSKKHKLFWKFCGNDANMSRPDKIVVYFVNLAEMKAKLPVLRSCLEGAQFHKISHCASTAELGLEARTANGIFVGADPSFLPGISWRFYRWAVISSIELNKKFWKGRKAGISGAFRLFNLSTQHEGPVKFKTSKRAETKIKELWQEIL